MKTIIIRKAEGGRHESSNSSGPGIRIGTYSGSWRVSHRKDSFCIRKLRGGLALMGLVLRAQFFSSQARFFVMLFNSVAIRRFAGHVIGRIHEHY